MDNRDIILKFLSENKNRHFTQSDLQKVLFPDLSVDVVKDLLYQIIEHKHNLMRVFNESSIGVLPVQYSGLIDSFLENGGFTKLNNESKIVKELEDYKDSKKEVSKFTKSPKQKFEFTYDGIISYLKSNKIAAIILILIVAFFGISKIINEYAKTKENIEKLNNTSDNKNQDFDSTKTTSTADLDENIILNPELIDSLKLPYLKNVPILDKGIFLRYNYNYLILGGANIDSVKINARTYDGEFLEFDKYVGKVEYDITRQPYIEMEYKGSIYSIEIIGKHHSFEYV